jgi:exodeoxyribonuclease VII small subunit
MDGNPRRHADAAPALGPRGWPVRCWTTRSAADSTQRLAFAPRQRPCRRVGLHATEARAGQVGPSALTTIVNSLSEMANKTASSDGPAASAASYEDALAELERLVAAMEGGQMPLERLLESYRRGAELLGFCRSRLDAVEQQVKVLEDGQLKPWAES